MSFDCPALNVGLVALWILGAPGHPMALWFYRGWGTGTAHVIHPQMRIMSLCVSIAFLCMSLDLSVCLYVCMSKSLHVFVCMFVCPSLSLNICGVVPADQGSRARYRAFQVFCWDSKSVLFTMNLSWWKPVIMVLNYVLFIRNHYPPPLHLPHE